MNDYGDICFNEWNGTGITIDINDQDSLIRIPTPIWVFNCIKDVIML